MGAILVSFCTNLHQYTPHGISCASYWRSLGSKIYFYHVFGPFPSKKKLKKSNFHVKTVGARFAPFYTILRHFTPFYAMWRQKNLWKRFIWVYATFCWVYEPFPIKKTVKIVRFSWVNCWCRFCAILRHFAPFCATNTSWIRFFLSKMCSYSVYRPYWV